MNRIVMLRFGFHSAGQQQTGAHQQDEPDFAAPTCPAQLFTA
jgi:hypothetical protein